MAKKAYEPEPEIPPALRERYATMLEVIQGRLTVSEGARRLELSRNHFQTLLHRGLGGLLEGITPGEAGRPGKPAREVELERENARLRKENERLRGRTEMTDRLLAVASGVIRGRVRSTRVRAARKEGSGEGEEPDPVREMRMRIDAERTLREAGLPAALSCAVIGASPATLRRWRRHGAAARGPALPTEVAAGLRSAVDALVRSLRGQVGAEAIRRAVPGISRRTAAALKHETLTAMERERKSAAERIEVTTPGVMRGFDAMHVPTLEGRRYALVAADAAVPFRTSALATRRYDGASVAEVLEHDFEEHGAPLVLRADRARCHRVPEVLQGHGVLLLQGPPRHPRYYGQLERQNREHRAWLTAGGPISADDLDRLCHEMLLALNAAWIRRGLGWRTSEEAWDARTRVNVDRASLRAEVEDRAARIRRRADGRAAVAAMAERLAIESALTKLGYLRREPGGGCQVN